MEAIEPSVVQQDTPGKSAPVTRPFSSIAFILAICAIFLFYRKPDAFLNPQFYGEDGVIYFMDSLEIGWKVIFQLQIFGTYYVYQGLVAYAGSFLPVRYVPHFYNYVCFLTTLGVIAYIMRARIQCPYKALLALTIIVCPHGGEVYLALTNIHWILGLIPLLVLISDDPRRRWVGFLELGLVFLLLMSGPLVIVFLPLYFLRLYFKRTRYSVALVVLAVLCTIPQTRHVIPDRYPGKINIWDPDWIGCFGNTMAGYLYFTKEMNANERNSWCILALTVLTWGGLLAASWRWKEPKYLFLVLAAMSLMASTAYSLRSWPGGLAVGGSRYTYIPLVCTIWSLIFLAGQCRRLQKPVFLVLILISAAGISYFPTTPFVDFHWKDASRVFGRPIACYVPINPAGWNFAYPRAITKFSKPPLPEEELDVQPCGRNQMEFVNGAWRATGGNPGLVFKLGRPVFVYTLTLTFSLEDGKTEPTDFEVFWKQDGKDDFGTPWHKFAGKVSPGKQTQQIVVSVFHKVDQIRIDPDPRPCTFRLQQMKISRPPESGAKKDSTLIAGRGR